MKLKHIAAILFVLFLCGVVGQMDYEDELLTACIAKGNSVEVCK